MMYESSNSDHTNTDPDCQFCGLSPCDPTCVIALADRTFEEWQLKALDEQETVGVERSDVMWPWYKN